MGSSRPVDQEQLESRRRTSTQEIGNGVVTRREEEQLQASLRRKSQPVPDEMQSDTMLFTASQKLQSEAEPKTHDTHTRHLEQDTYVAYTLTAVFPEDDLAFPAIRQLLQARGKDAEVAKARAHYRPLVAQLQKKRSSGKSPSSPMLLVAVVNLACCHMVLGLPKLALPLLDGALKLQPGCITAHLNRILCFRRLDMASAVLSAIRLLLKDAVNAFKLSSSEQKMVRQCQDWARSRCRKGQAESSEAPRESAECPRETSADLSASVATWKQSFLEAYDVDLTGASLPDWGRLHSYCDDEAVALKGESLLKQSHLASLRQSLAPQRTLLEARRAYEHLKGLQNVFLQQEDAALRLLQLVEMLDLQEGEHLYRRGDSATYCYVILSGSIRIEAVDLSLGQQPVVLQTFYDGQLLGEKMVESTWQEDAIAQETTCLLRMLPADLRGCCDSMPAQRPLSADPVLCRVRALQRSRFFSQVEWQNLVDLASACIELELRFGDAVFKVGEDKTKACFLVVEGLCRLHVPMPKGRTEDAEARPRLLVPLPGTGDMTPRRPATGGPRPATKGHSWSRAGMTQTPRTVAKELSSTTLGYLRQGDLFGLAALGFSSSELSKTAVNVHVESCFARLLILDQRSVIQNLTDEQMGRVSEVLRGAEDPAWPTARQVQESRDQQRRWWKAKQTLLDQMLTPR